MAPLEGLPVQGAVLTFVHTQYARLAAAKGSGSNARARGDVSLLLWATPMQSLLLHV